MWLTCTFHTVWGLYVDAHCDDQPPDPNMLGQMHTDTQCALIWNSRVSFHNTLMTHDLMRFYMSYRRLWIVQVVCMHRSWNVVVKVFPAERPKTPSAKATWTSLMEKHEGSEEALERARKYPMSMHSSSLFGSWLIVVTLLDSMWFLHTQ